MWGDSWLQLWGHFAALGTHAALVDMGRLPFLGTDKVVNIYFYNLILHKTFKSNFMRFMRARVGAGLGGRTW